MTNEEIKSLRLSLNETQGKFASRFHRTTRCIRKWETGETTPPKAVMKTLVELARNLNGGK